MEAGDVPSPAPTGTKAARISGSADGVFEDQQEAVDCEAVESPRVEEDASCTSAAAHAGAALAEAEEGFAAGAALASAAAGLEAAVESSEPWKLLHQLRGSDM